MIWRIQWQGPQFVWAAVALLAVVLLAIGWLYRPQVRALSSKWGALLLILRTLALGVLVLSLLRPTILTPLTGSDRGLVAILIDQSRSMDAIDTTRSPAELVQVAAALDVLPEGARSPRLSELRQRVNDLRELIDDVARARSELEYARLSGHGIDAAGAHLRQTRSSLQAAVRAASVAAAGADVADLSAAISRISGESAGEQLDRVLSRIDQLQTTADASLFQTNSLVRSACDVLANQSRIELVQQVLQSGQVLLDSLRAERPVRVFGYSRSIEPLQMEAEVPLADGPRTDLPAAMRELRQQLILQRVAAVVVFSDGREAGGVPAPLIQWDLPIVSINMAATTVRDMAIERVTLPETAFVGETISVRADLRASGLSDPQVDVTLSGEGIRITRPVQFVNGVAHAEFAVPMRVAGPQELTVTLPGESREAMTANNSVRRVVKVISDRLRVGMLAGSATRDFQQLRGALQDAPGFDLSSRIVADGSCDWTEQQLLGLDVLILNDVPVGTLDSRQWDAAVRLVSERGGSVIVIPASPTTAAAYATNPLAASLLPWRGDAQPAWRIWPGEDAVFRILPPGPDALDALRLSSDPDINRTRWNQLPPVFRFMALPPLKSGVRSLLSDRDSGLPVLTDMRLGAGHVLFLGMNELWRWRPALEDADGNRIWRQIVRVAGGEPYAVSQNGLSLDARRLHLEPGEPLEVRARVRSNSNSSSSDERSSFGAAAPVLQLFSNGTMLRNELLTTAPGAAGRYLATVADLAQGRYTLRLSHALGSVELPVVVAENSEDEVRDVSGDRNELRRISGSRGEVLDFASIRSLPQRLARLGRNEPHFSEVRLWDSPYLFLFVVGCLGVEWAIRKRSGLA